MFQDYKFVVGVKVICSWYLYTKSNSKIEYFEGLEMYWKVTESAFEFAKSSDVWEMFCTDDQVREIW